MMRNKRAISGLAIDRWNGIGCDFAGERIEPCGLIKSSRLTGKQLKRQSALDSTGQFGPVVRFPSDFQQQTKLI